MTGLESLPVTIAIPVFATPPALLHACLRSIAEARGHTDQVFVVVDGPQPLDLENVVCHAPRFGFQVVRQTTRLGLVANWNACLQLGSHELVHVMHADDAVAPEFYIAARRAMELGHVAAVAAGRFPPARSGPVAVLRGEEAARYLLSHQKPAAGSFVLRRSALGTPLRGFDPRFSYCPDEELFLRTVASGDLALVDQRLYLESQHDHQARYSTWHRPDFADVYYAARAEGARAVDVDLAPAARRQSSRRLLSVGRFLCRAGDRRAARAIARSIAAHDKGSLVTWRYWALVLLATALRERGSSMVSPVTGLITGPRSDR